MVVSRIPILNNDEQHLRCPSLKMLLFVPRLPRCIKRAFFSES